MPYKPLISKIRCHNPNQIKSKICNRNYAVYIGTREGVDLSSDEKKYENLEDDTISQISSNKLYSKYIAERPNSNGLFGNIDVTNIEAVGNYMSELTDKNRNIYRGIVSLSPADATNLGYDEKTAWVSFIKSTIPDVAKEFNIPIQDLEWCAAVHMEPTHPHCHYMFWSKNDMVASPFIHTSTQDRIREKLSKEMFKDEYLFTVTEKNKARDMLLSSTKKILAPERIDKNTLSSIGTKIVELCHKLPSKGRLDYKLLPPSTKSEIDIFVDTLLSHNVLKKEFNTYMDTIDKLSTIYSASINHSEMNKKIAEEDIRKRIANIILKQCKQIQKQEAFFSAYSNSNPTEEPQDISDSEISNPGDANIPKKVQRDIFSFYKSNSMHSLELVKNHADNGNGYASYVYAKYITRLDPTRHSEIEIDNYYKNALLFFSKKNTTKRTASTLYKLGTMYEKGLGTTSDPKMAYFYYLEAANIDASSWANYSLGKIYSDSTSAFFNPSKAINCFEKFLTHNDNSYCQYQLGKLYSNYNYDTYNPEKAIEYLNNASNHNNIYALAKLGNIYLWGNHPNIMKNKDYGKKLLEKAASLNNKYAAESLKMYKEYETSQLESNLIGVGYRCMKSIFSTITKRNSNYESYISSNAHSKDAQIDKLTRQGMYVDPIDKK